MADDEQRRLAGHGEIAWALEAEKEGEKGPRRDLHHTAKLRSKISGTTRSWNGGATAVATKLGLTAHGRALRARLGFGEKRIEGGAATVL